VLIALTAGILTTTGSGLGFMSFAMTGANVVGPTDVTALNLLGNDRQKATATFVLDGLNPGVTTFTAKYRAQTPGEACFQNRSIWVAPL
jgi:hypothetical protein